MPKINTKEAAVRFAGAAISEILLYHEEEADWNGPYASVLEALASPIAEGRSLFESRVESQFYGIFDQELRSSFENLLAKRKGTD